MPHPVDRSALDAPCTCVRANAYRCRLNFCERRRFASRALLRYGRKTLETVLGKYIDTTFGNSRTLREEGTEVRLEILRWREGHKQHTQ